MSQLKTGRGQKGSDLVGVEAVGERTVSRKELHIEESKDASLNIPQEGKSHTSQFCR